MPPPVDLAAMSHRGYHPGRPVLTRVAWLLIEALIFLNPIVTSYALKRVILRLFGATIGKDVIIKPSVHIKYPWHLRVGDACWIGERSWVDNFVSVDIASNVCISQGAYLCTGNHDWSDPGMGLQVAPIVIAQGVWVGAFARVGPGVVLARESVLTLGSTLTKDAVPRGIYQGVPARRIGRRKLVNQPSAG